MANLLLSENKTSLQFSAIHLECFLAIAAAVSSVCRWARAPKTLFPQTTVSCGPGNRRFSDLIPYGCHISSGFGTIGVGNSSESMITSCWCLSWTSTFVFLSFSGGLESIWETIDGLHPTWAAIFFWVCPAALRSLIRCDVAGMVVAGCHFKLSKRFYNLFLGEMSGILWEYAKALKRYSWSAEIMTQ